MNAQKNYQLYKHSSILEDPSEREKKMNSILVKTQTKAKLKQIYCLGVKLKLLPSFESSSPSSERIHNSLHVSFLHDCLVFINIKQMLDLKTLSAKTSQSFTSYFHLNHILFCRRVALDPKN